MEIIMAGSRQDLPADDFQDCIDKAQFALNYLPSLDFNAHIYQSSLGNDCLNFLIDDIDYLTKKLWVTHAPVDHKRCKAAPKSQRFSLFHSISSRLFISLHLRRYVGQRNPVTLLRDSFKKIERYSAGDGTSARNYWQIIRMGLGWKIRTKLLVI
jgi:hypothetical protein